MSTLNAQVEAPEAAQVPSDLDRRFSEVSDQVAPLLRARARRLSRGNPRLALELEQEGRIGAWEALSRFDSTRGVPLPPHATRYGMYRMSDYLRAERATARRYEYCQLVDDPDEEHEVDEEEWLAAKAFSRPDHDPSRGDPLFELVEAENVSEVRGFVAALPARLNTIAHAIYVEGLSQAEVARKLAVSRTAITKAVKRIHALARGSAALSRCEAAA